MSAYALSGLFLPAVGTPLPETKPAHTEISSCSARGEGAQSKSHSYEISAATKNRNNEPGPSAEPVASALNGSPCEETGDCNNSGELIVVVKRAKIDTIGLIQSATKRSCPKVENRRPALSAPVPPVSSLQDEDESDRDCKVNPVEPLPTSRPPTWAAPHNHALANPHNHAIQFEMSISFNGRKYEAVRTMPRFIQLRNDLVQELCNRGNTARGRLGRRRDRIRRQMEMNNKCCDGFGASKTESDDDSGDSCNGDDAERVVTIPDLPVASGDAGTSSESGKHVLSGSGGFGFGRGFTMLQAILHSYCPAIEGWLRQVAAIVPPHSSPTWTKFLWEPLYKQGVLGRTAETNRTDLSNKIRGKSTKMKRRNSHESFSTLQSIEEDDSDPEEEQEVPFLHQYPSNRTDAVCKLAFDKCTDTGLKIVARPQDARAIVSNAGNDPPFESIDVKTLSIE